MRLLVGFACVDAVSNRRFNYLKHVYPTIIHNIQRAIAKSDGVQAAMCQS
ncbi:MAG: hypothetical protein ICV54_00980 [Nostoc sp. C3-bin3]|nr:hypothetical protein [Nostoc sp. C3-bin3]